MPGPATSRTIARLQAENARLRAECLRNRRQELLEHLLRGEFPSVEQITADLQSVGIMPEKQSFLEVYVNVRLVPPAAEQPSGSARPVSNFRAVYEDGLSARIRAAFSDNFLAATRWGSGVAAILQFDPMVPQPGEVITGAFIHDLNQNALRLADDLRALHGMDIFVALSRPHDGVEGIPAAHREIQKIDTYRTVMGIDVPVLCYHDFELAAQDSLGSDSALQLERSYLTSVELGDFEQARAALQQLIDLEFRRAVPALDTLQSKLSSKLELLLIALEKFKTAEDPQLFREVQQMQTALSLGSLTVDDLRQQIDRIFDWIARSLSQQQAPKWMNGLLSYVDENFTCPELNVASIAEALGLNPSYLSREVKRCTGMGLLDLLQKKRLDRAVALLAADHSLTDAARLSGFGNLRALRRAMKRYQEESL
jgi:AraC-like DNA-binding protein